MCGDSTSTDNNDSRHCSTAHHPRSTKDGFEIVSDGDGAGHQHRAGTDIFTDAAIQELYSVELWKPLGRGFGEGDGDVGADRAVVELLASKRLPEQFKHWPIEAVAGHSYLKQPQSSLWYPHYGERTGFLESCLH